MTAPTTKPAAAREKSWVAKELDAAKEFAKRDWDRTKHDLEDLKEEFQRARAKQKSGEESQAPSPGSLSDYQPSRGEPQEEHRGWTLTDPHHDRGHGHRELGR